MRVRVLMVSGLLAALGVAGPPAGLPAAQAHAVLVSTTPPADSTLAQAPDHVGLLFAQPLLGLGTAVKVTGPSGVVSRGAPRVRGDSVSQGLAGGLGPGRYLVLWRVTSADGHPVSGEFDFAVTGSTTGTGTGEGAGPPAASGSPAAGGGVGWPVWVLLGGVAAAAAAGAASVRHRHRPDRA